MISLIVLTIFIVIASGSFDLILLALGSRWTYVNDEGNYVTYYTDYYGEEERYEGKRDAYGRWHGKIQINYRDYADRRYRTDEVTYVHGWPHGKKKITYGPDYIRYECYDMGYKIDCPPEDDKSTFISASDTTASQILKNKYPSFLLSLSGYPSKEDSVLMYIDSLESIVLNNEYDIDEFDDYYDDARDQLESGIFDTIWNRHDFLILQGGIDELKQSEFRMAVIDNSRLQGNTTFSKIQESHPNYMKDINDEGVNNADFEGFCDILDSLIQSYGSLDLNDPLFIDSVEYRMYQALDKIYNGEYKSAQANLNKSAVRLNYKVIKDLKKNIDSYGSINADPEDVAGLVGTLMQKHYNRADKIRMAVREAYLKKGGVIDLPIAVTTWGDTISTTSLNIYGHVLEDGGAEITGRGVAWATFYNPTVDDNYIESGSGMGEFTVNMEEMESGETYYFRSYALNSAGIAYGNCVSFKSGVTGAEVISEHNNDFIVYPNPATDFATIQIYTDSPEHWKFIISDMQGRIVYTKEQSSFGENSIRLNLANFESGVYNCRLINGENQFSKKLVIVD